MAATADVKANTATNSTAYSVKGAIMTLKEEGAASVDTGPPG